MTKFAGRLDVVGVAWAGDDPTYQRFVDDHRLTFPQALDTQGELFAHFSVPGQPAWVFVGRDGTSLRHLDAMEPAELTKAFDKLLG